MAKVKIELHNDGFRALLKSDNIYESIKPVAEKVLNEAENTASAAEKGSGGRIDGYAAAGFSLTKHTGGTRVEARIESNADSETFLRAFFYTVKRDGVPHLRRALYKFTRRGV